MVVGLALDLDGSVDPLMESILELHKLRQVAEHHGFLNTAACQLLTAMHFQDKRGQEGLVHHWQMEQILELVEALCVQELCILISNTRDQAHHTPVLLSSSRMYARGSFLTGGAASVESSRASARTWFVTAITSSTSDCARLCGEKWCSEA